MKSLTKKFNYMLEYTNNNQNDDYHFGLYDELMEKFVNDSRVNGWLFFDFIMNSDDGEFGEFYDFFEQNKKKFIKYLNENKKEFIKEKKFNFIEYLGEYHFEYAPFVLLEYILEKRNISYEIKEEYIDFTYKLI